MQSILLTISNMRGDNTIQVSCWVSGTIGNLVDNPNQTPLLNGKQRRRVRSEATGTVVRLLEHRKWEVRLNTNIKLVPVAATAVIVIGNDEGLPMVSTTIFNCIL